MPFYYKGVLCLCQAKKGVMCYFIIMTRIEIIQKNLREAMRASGIPQKEIAKRLGINPSTVSKYMRLDIYPALDTFAELCVVLDITADELLGLA